MPKARSLTTIFKAKLSATKQPQKKKQIIRRNTHPAADPAADAEPASSKSHERDEGSKTVQQRAAETDLSHNGEDQGIRPAKRKRIQHNADVEQPSECQDTQGDCSKQAKDAASAQNSSSDVNAGVLRGWRCASVVDQQAAVAVHRLLQADQLKAHGATLKALTLAPHIHNKQATFAVTCETLKHLPVIRRLLDACELLQQQPRIQLPTAAVLTYELLFGKGLSKVKAAEKAVLACKDQLEKALQDLLGAKRAKDVSELLHQVDSAPSTQWPRSVRVNTLKTSVADAMKELQAWNGGTIDVKCDELLSDVLLLPPGTDLHDHPWVGNGRLVLQSRASCMPAHALQPHPYWTVVDCCAAPGNKTTHVAALLKGKGRVLAFDRDSKRLSRLKKNVYLLGASKVHAQLKDFLSVDPLDKQFAAVKGVILDPSCSGSGTVFSRMDHFLPSHEAAKQKLSTHPPESEVERVEQLGKFQETALRHALTFPALKRLVYSTCSVYERENEQVVEAVLPQATAAGFQLQDPFPSWHRRGLPLFDGCEKLIRTDPYEDGTDGFFVAVFQRKDLGKSKGDDG